MNIARCFSFHFPFLRTLQAVTVLLLLVSRAAAAESEAPDKAAMQEISNMGEGFLVWERALQGDKGDWQIWTRPLAPEGKEELLVPLEEGHDHFCPKLSPHGIRLAFMSYKRGSDPYDRQAKGALWMMDLATRKLTLLAAKAMSYQEDRAVCWFDNKRLCYIDGEGDTYEMNVVSGKSKRLIKEARGRFGFLVNSTKTLSTSGDPEFAPFDASTGNVENQSVLDGCQPYFTQNGKWGFWMSGVGGPISCFYPPLRRSTPIIDMHDPRMPANRGYVYFPMLSPCMRLFAFAASPDQHDHFTSNYNLFVSRIDPETLELIGKPVRYSWFSGTDRYPDVYAQPLPLGSQYFEGSAGLSFPSPDGQPCSWRINGASMGTAAVLHHEFEKEGSYWIESESGGQTRRGYVHIRPAVVPSVVSVVRGDQATLLVGFNEPVNLDHATVTAGATSLRWKGLSADGRIGTIELPSEQLPLANVMIRGVRDKAPQPREMPPTAANVGLKAWPPFRDSLVFGWQNHKTTPSNVKQIISPEAHGRAFWSPSGGISANGGWYDMAKAGNFMMHDCSRTRAFTVEAVLTCLATPSSSDEAFPLFSLETRKGEVRFALLQKWDGFFLGLVTEQKSKLTWREMRLAPSPARQPQHLVVTYDEGEITAYINGVPSLPPVKMPGRMVFDKWEGTFKMATSSKYPGQHWFGSAEQLACYDRAVSAGEAATLFDYAAPLVQKLTVAKPASVRAKLLQVSHPPTLKEINPYHEALAKNLYEVLPGQDAAGDAKATPPAGSTVVVAHWVWINGEAAPAAPAEIGKEYTLLLEPLPDHPELRSLLMKDDLTDGLSSDEYLEVTGWQPPAL